MDVSELVDVAIEDCCGAKSSHRNVAHFCCTTLGLVALPNRGINASALTEKRQEFLARFVMLSK